MTFIQWCRAPCSFRIFLGNILEIRLHGEEFQEDRPLFRSMKGTLIPGARQTDQPRGVLRVVAGTMGVKGDAETGS